MRNLVDIYVRLSDEDRDKRCITDESESIQNQKSMLIKYCIEQGWQIYNIYCDEDYSGADKNRPAFNQMIKDCEAGKVDIVLCKTQSRFSRDMEIIEHYLHGKFIEWNIRFVSIVDHADTSVVGNKKSRQINGLVNEWYLEDLSDNIRRTLRHKQEKGEFCCPYPPYGYKLDPEDKHHFVIDPPAVNVVKSIFEMYKQGMGYIRIAKALNEKKIPSPAVYKEMQGLNYRNPNAESVSSRQWKDNTIYTILRNEVYTGKMIQGKSKNVSYKNKKRIKLPKEQWIVVDGTHEPIIDENLWNDVLDQRKNRRGAGDKQFQCSDSEVNPLRGIVYCKECGSSMWRSSYQCAEARNKYYRCRTVKNSEGVCDNVYSVRQDTIESVVLQEIQNLVENLLDEKQIAVNAKNPYEDRLKLARAEKKNKEKEVEKLRSDSVYLYRDKINGVINDSQFQMLNESFNDEIAKCNDRIKVLGEEIAVLENKMCNQLTKEEILSKYKNVEKLDYELLHELIDKICIGKLDKETKTREIEIYWKF